MLETLQSLREHSPISYRLSGLSIHGVEDQYFLYSCLNTWFPAIAGVHG